MKDCSWNKNQYCRLLVLKQNLTKVPCSNFLVIFTSMCVCQDVHASVKLITLDGRSLSLTSLASALFKMLSSFLFFICLTSLSGTRNFVILTSSTVLSSFLYHIKRNILSMSKNVCNSWVNSRFVWFSIYGRRIEEAGKKRNFANFKKKHFSRVAVQTWC